MDYKIKAELKSTKILVVEDDPIMITLLRDVLKVMGFGEITLVNLASKGLEELRLTAFDLIFTDWRLPYMSGIDFVKAVRSIPNQSKCYVPIIMLTGNARKEDVEIARDAGVTEYMIKPFSIKSLCAKIKEIVERPRQFVLNPGLPRP